MNVLHRIVAYLPTFQTYSIKINTFEPSSFPNTHQIKTQSFTNKKIKKSTRPKKKKKSLEINFSSSFFVFFWFLSSTFIFFPTSSILNFFCFSFLSSFSLEKKMTTMANYKLFFLVFFFPPSYVATSSYSNSQFVFQIPLKPE
jgi:flagellar biosynthesis protein FlhB